MLFFVLILCATGLLFGSAFNSAFDPRCCRRAAIPFDYSGIASGLHVALPMCCPWSPANPLPPRGAVDVLRSRPDTWKSLHSLLSPRPFASWKCDSVFANSDEFLGRREYEDGIVIRFLHLTVCIFSPSITVGKIFPGPFPLARRQFPAFGSGPQQAA